MGFGKRGGEFFVEYPGKSIEDRRFTRAIITVNDGGIAIFVSREADFGRFAIKLAEVK